MRESLWKMFATNLLVFVVLLFNSLAKMGSDNILEWQVSEMHKKHWGTNIFSISSKFLGVEKMENKLAPTQVASSPGKSSIH